MTFFIRKEYIKKKRKLLRHIIVVKQILMLMYKKIEWNPSNIESNTLHNSYKNY